MNIRYHLTQALASQELNTSREVCSRTLFCRFGRALERQSKFVPVTTQNSPETTKTMIRAGPVYIGQ